MLTRSATLAGTPGNFRGLGIAALSQPMAGSVALARVFGAVASVPRGYGSERAIRLPLRTNGETAARFDGVFSFAAALTATGNMTAAFGVETDLTPEGNVLLNGYVTFALEIDLTADLRGRGNVAAVFDIPGRPTAFDIAQEVWAAQQAAFTTTGTMGKAQSDAVSAAKLAAALSA